MLNIKPQRLHAAIAAVAPIVGVSIGAQGDSTSVTVEYDPTATQAQAVAAAAVLAAFDWSDAADAAYADTVEPDLSTMRNQGPAALDGNTTFLAIAAPTNAQLGAQVRALTQQNQRLIKAAMRLIARSA